MVRRLHWLMRAFSKSPLAFRLAPREAADRLARATVAMIVAMPAIGLLAELPPRAFIALRMKVALSPRKEPVDGPLMTGGSTATRGHPMVHPRDTGGAMAVMADEGWPCANDARAAIWARSGYYGRRRVPDRAADHQDHRQGGREDAGDKRPSQPPRA